MKKSFRNIPILLVIFLVGVVLYQIKSTVFALSFDCSSVTDVSETECNTLVGIYNSTDGANWNNNTNWLGSGDSTLDTVCDREGITCDGGDITDLSLANNNLSGDVNLSGLTNLTGLDLRDNQLLNIDLNDVFNLQRLNLSHNQLSNINLSGLTNLVTLILSDNQLSDIDLSMVSNLQGLNLGYNQFTDIDLGGLTGLVFLSLNNNQISDINLSKLSNLQELDLSYNQISSIDLTGLVSLTTPYLNNNQISTINLAGLTGITSLNLMHNQLVDISLSGLNGLIYLYLGSNQLSNIDLSVVPNLQELGLSYNQFTGISLSGMNEITRVYLNDNQLLNVEINGLIKILALYLQNNYIISLSDSLNTLTDLTYLNLQNNCINTGSFSSSLNSFLNSIDTVIWGDQSVNCSSSDDDSDDNSNNGGGGGGGGYSIPPVTGTITTGGVYSTGVSGIGNILGSHFSTEFNNAYLYAYSIGITTMPTIQEANIEGNLIRSHMAKMMVNYAIKVMSGTINTGRQCNFDDIQDQSQEMRTYIQLACQLGIMGVGMQSFVPDGIVTRAEFGTVLSRVLYGDMYNDGEFYYSNHLKILKDNGIITNDDPTLEELRGYVMLMLMRASK